MMKRILTGLFMLMLVLGLWASAQATAAQSLTVVYSDPGMKMCEGYDQDLLPFLAVEVENTGNENMHIAVSLSDNLVIDPNNAYLLTEGLSLLAGEKGYLWALPVDGLTQGSHAAWVKLEADNGEIRTVDMTLEVVPAWKVTPNAYDFGKVLVTGTLPTLDVSVTNTWDEAVTLTCFDTAHFTLNKAYEIAAGATETVTIQFANAELGLFEYEDLHLCDMNGDVIFATISLSYEGYTDAALAPDVENLDWGAVRVNAPGEAQTVTLKNNTAAQVTVTASTGDAYTVTPASFTLPAGESLTVDVALTTVLLLEDQTETVTFTTSAGDTAQVNLLYYGLPFVRSEETIHFGVFRVGSTMDYRGVYVSDLSDTDLTFTVSVPQGFEVDPQCLDASGKFRVAAGEGSVLTLKPADATLAAAGEYTGEVVLTEANAPSHPHKITLTVVVNEDGSYGNLFSVIPNAIDFGEVDVNSGDAKIIFLSLTNDSTEDVYDIGYEYSGSELSGLSAYPMMAGETITVEFMLEGGFRLGQQRETLILKGGTNAVHIPVSYTGVSSQAANTLTLTPDWDAGGYTVLYLYEGYDPDAECRQLTIGNSGQTDLTVSASLVGGRMENLTNVVIPAGGSQRVSVFAPPSSLGLGEYKATLTVTSTDGQAASYDIYFRVLPKVTVNPTTIDLGVVPTVGEKPTGTVTLTFPGNQFTDAYAEVLATGDGFTFDPRGTEMAGNSTQDIVFALNEVLPGQQTKTFIIESSNGFLFDTVTVTYTGEAPSPLAVDVGSIDLGSLYPNGAIESPTVTLTNNTNEAVTVSGETTGSASVRLSSTTIPAGGSVTATLDFSGNEMAVGQGSETVTFTAGGSSAMVNVSYEILNPIQADVTSLDFGGVEAGAALPQGKTVTLTNLSPTDEAMVQVTVPEGFGVTGVNSSNYLSVMPGQSGQITVTPSATAQGVYTGSLTLKEENCSQALTVALSYEVYGPNPLTAYLNGTEKYLAEGYDADQVSPLTLTVGNTGATPVDVALACDQGSLSNSQVTVAAGGNVDVYIAPPAGLEVGDHTATITLTAGRYTKTATLTFKVMAGVTIEPTTINFGELSTLAQLPTATFTITNPRDTVLELAAIDCEYFTFDPAYGEVPAGGSLTITAKPTRIEEGTITSTAEIGDNFDEEMILGKVTLTYTGVKPKELVADKTSIDLGQFYSNAPAYTTVTLTNNTNEAVSVTAQAGSGCFANLASHTIPALGSVEATVGFNAKLAVGSAQGQVTFTTATDSVTVALAGTVKHSFTVNPETIAFGGIAEGGQTPAAQQVTVNNLSGAEMAVTLKTTGSFKTEPEQLVFEGSSATFTVVPTATDAGEYTGAVTLEEANTAGTVKIDLSFNIAKVKKSEVVDTVEALPPAPIEEPVLVLAPEAVPENETVILHFAKVEEEIPDEEEIPADEPVVGSVTYEVFLKNDEGEEVELEAACQLIFPYPQGMSAETASLYDITIVHYADNGPDTYTKDEIQFLPQGMSITVHSFSPFEITYKREPGQMTLESTSGLVIRLPQGYDVATLNDLPTFGVSNTGASDLTLSYTAQGDGATINFVNGMQLAPGTAVEVKVTPKAGLAVGEYKTTFTFTADTGDTQQVVVTVIVTPAPKAPATGDNATPILWALMLMTALVVMPKRKRA